ncbi:MAG: RNA polymerase sigma factor [Thiobacillus sp.]|nr:RNA polymerase sigma factor [Thiobacillus sp.]
MNLSSQQSDRNAILASMRSSVPADENQRTNLLVELINQMASGDEAALNQLYELTLSRVFGLALKVTGRHDLAEEVCVETYWQCWRDASRFDGVRGQPLAWIMVIARSRALDALRRLDKLSYCAEPELLLEYEDCPKGTPLDRLLDREESSALAAAIKTLTSVQRQLLALAFYRDLSHQEISDQTGLPLGTVKSHLKRAQQALRNVLSQI